jgi:CheY-like chemotaxis protein
MWITIAAENVSLTGSDNPDRLSGDFVRVSIADTGCGIPADILPRVFEPFFTTKAVDKGSGLGLAQVHGFAHQSCGTVTLESEIGRGTRVTLYLPRAMEPATAAQSSAEVQAEAMGRLLLVEDNPDVADATDSMLLQLGYDVTHARSASAALSATKTATFDLVISDILMAGEMNGLDLARKLRELYPELPVMLATGYSNLADVAAKEFTLMRKPYQASEIVRAAANLLAQARHRAPDNLVNLREVREAARARRAVSPPLTSSTRRCCRRSDRSREALVQPIAWWQRESPLQRVARAAENSPGAGGSGTTRSFSPSAACSHRATM